MAEIIVESIPKDKVIQHAGGTRSPERTWSAIINKITSMTAGEASEYFGVLANNEALPQGVTLKELMVARAIQDFMEKPNSAIWNAIMERSEGKVADAVNIHKVEEITISIQRAEPGETKEIDVVDQET